VVASVYATVLFLK